MYHQNYMKVIELVGWKYLYYNIIELYKYRIVRFKIIL